jgi:hypothetical protein
LKVLISAIIPSLGVTRELREEEICLRVGTVEGDGVYRYRGQLLYFGQYLTLGLVRPSVGKDVDGLSSPHGHGLRESV